MTVASDTNRSGPYPGNGITVDFDYDFKIVDPAHVKVILTDDVGAETTLELDTHYTVSGVKNEEGGTIHLVTPPAVGELITNLLNVPFTQNIDLENQGAYYAETVERGLDLATMRAQQLQEQINRAVVIPPSADPSGLDTAISGILRLMSSADNVDTVANISPQVVIVSGIASEVSVVAGMAANVIIVAGIEADVSTVAAIQAAIGVVAGIEADVTVVANNAASISQFAKFYLGNKAADPATDNEGNALASGAMYWNTSLERMRVYKGAVGGWDDFDQTQHSIAAFDFTAVQGQTVFTGADDNGNILQYRPGLSIVMRNGVRLVKDDDYFATDSGTVTLAIGANAGNVITVLAFSSFQVADTYTQAEVDALIAAVESQISTTSDPWSRQPLGVPIPVFTHILGVSPPPTDKSFRYILLTAGEDGIGQYNEGVLEGESVSGSFPLVQATATISDPLSPLNGRSVNLINTEQRFLRSGNSGVLEDDAMQLMTGDWTANRLSYDVGTANGVLQSTTDGSAGGVTNSGTGGGTGSKLLFDNSAQVRTADENRPKSIGADFYMRIR